MIFIWYILTYRLSKPIQTKCTTCPLCIQEGISSPMILNKKNYKGNLAQVLQLIAK